MISALRAARGRWLVTALLVVSGWAGALSVVGTPEVTGTSGDYVTLGFRLVGEGDYTYTVTTPDGWDPLARSGRVSVAGDGFVSVTIRIPTRAPADSTADVEIVFIGTDDPTDVATGMGQVHVTAFVGIELIGPRDLVGELGVPMELSVMVRNRGNMPDVALLTADGGMWDVRFESNAIPLEPGEQREVPIVMLPTGSVTSGYRHVLWVTATSSNDPSVATRSFTQTVFVDSRMEADTGARRDPRLVLSVGSGLTAGITFEESGTSHHLGYDLNPRLTGALSDYVDVTAGVGSLSGSIVDPFEQVPSRFDVGLAAERWDAAASLSAGSYALSGGALVGEWRVGAAATYMEREDSGQFGVTASAVSQMPGLDLQVVGRTSTTPSGRSDSLGARYRTPLSDALMLTVGADVIGTATTDDYRVALGVNESLTFQAQWFDFTQAYSGVPQAGVHNLGLSGGLRSVGPFGVRASTSLQLAPASYRWRNSVTVSASPLPGVGVAVTGSYATGTDATTWSVRPSLSLRYRVAGASGGLGVSYAHTGVLRGDESITDLYAASSTLSFGAVTLRAAASHLHRSATSGEPGGALLNASAEAEYRLAARSLLSARYQYESDTMEGEGTTTASVAWTQSWSEDLGSRLSYERNQTTAYATGAYEQTERIALVGQVDDLLVDGLTLSAGYAVSSEAGLLTGSPLRHDVSARLGYTFALAFDTPDALVQLFGGRRGGEVHGVAFLDRDLDGVRSDGEQVLANLVVQLGDESVMTDSDGRFRLRVPEGTHGWSFGSGLPAGMAASIPATVQVVENSVQELHIAFVPVVNVTVTLFDDVDNDGVRGAEEGGIAFGGVILDGPVTQVVRVDGRGTVTVSGLVPGRYLVTADPERLPPRYRPTGEPFVLVIREGDRPAPIFIGAGAPPREVVTTFTASSLAVIGRSDSSSVETGGELGITALVSGVPQRVTAEYGAEVVELSFENGRWTGVITIPADAQAGRAVVLVRAVNESTEATSEVAITVRRSDE